MPPLISRPLTTAILAEHVAQDQTDPQRTTPPKYGFFNSPVRASNGLNTCTRAPYLTRPHWHWPLLIGFAIERFKSRFKSAKTYFCLIHESRSDANFTLLQIGAMFCVLLNVPYPAFSPVVMVQSRHRWWWYSRCGSECHHAQTLDHRDLRHKVDLVGSYRPHSTGPSDCA